MIPLFHCRLSLFILVLLSVQVSGQPGHNVAPPPPAGLKSLSCGGRPVPQLEDINEKAGINFWHSYSPEKKNIPESMRGGVLLPHYAPDGRLGIFFPKPPTVKEAPEN